MIRVNMRKFKYLRSSLVAANKAMLVTVKTMKLQTLLTDYDQVNTAYFELLDVISKIDSELHELRDEHSVLKVKVALQSPITLFAETGGSIVINSAKD